MSHRKDLMKQGFKSKAFGKQETLQNVAIRLKQKGVLKAYRVVPFNKQYELYVKG